MERFKCTGGYTATFTNYSDEHKPNAKEWHDLLHKDADCEVRIAVPGLLARFFERVAALCTKVSYGLCRWQKV